LNLGKLGISILVLRLQQLHVAIHLVMCLPPPELCITARLCGILGPGDLQEVVATIMAVEELTNDSTNRLGVFKS